MRVKADLHIHSCLSPCGSLEMSPLTIVERAISQGLDLIAISDHNAAMNLPALKKICDMRDEIDCFFGIEATSAEEAHNLCLFDDLDAALDFGNLIYESLAAIPNNPEKMGDQVYVNESDEIVGELENYLGSASSFSLEELLEKVHERGGLFIPAHIDRAAFSLSSQLGFVPENNYDGLELSCHAVSRGELAHISESILHAGNYPHITNSDAHYLDDIGRGYTEFELEDISLSSLKRALDEGKARLAANFR